MEWQIFAISQMGLIAIGLSAAFFMHSRSLKKQNDELRTHNTALEELSAGQDEESHPSPREWTKEHLSALSEEDPSYAVIKAVLKNAIRPKEDFLEKLPEVIASAGFTSGEAVSDEALQARVEELEAALAAQGGETPSDDQSAELKALLQQFTNDSREMMACIQQLESENAELKKQLEALTDSEDQANAAEEPSSDALTSSETTESSEDSLDETSATTEQDTAA